MRRLFLELLTQLEDIKVVLEAVQAFAKFLQVKDPSYVRILLFVQLAFQLLELVTFDLSKLLVGIGLLLELHEDELLIHFVDFLVSRLDLLL